MPLALLVAFGGGAVSGCADASVACPSLVPPAQAVLLVLLAVALVAFPRAAYLAAGAGVGMLVAGLVVAAVSALADLLAGVVGPASFGAGAGGGAGPGVGPAQGAPSATALVVVAVLVLAYLVAGLVVWRDRPVRRPWLGRPRASLWPSN
ncbi:MAG TPA: hypothetical protein VFW92_00410 [Candidatus Limnocylindrales bacterium]|nr:hypothetical protein [Candidatus Limnocylindrales bacterium]